jgi:putative oxidoreductase
MSKIAAIVGRMLLAIIFIVSGAGKMMDPAGTAQALAGVGLPGRFAIPAGIFELVAGLMLAVGFMVRLVALLLIVFTALTIMFFHHEFTDPVQGVMALKNLAIMGGLLLAFAHSHMWSHYYAITREHEGQRAALEAEKRAHEAELRAAKAEGLAEGRGDARAADPVVTDADRDGAPARHRRWFDW